MNNKKHGVATPWRSGTVGERQDACGGQVVLY